MAERTERVPVRVDPFHNLGGLMRDVFGAPQERGGWTPATNISENDEGYAVTIELAGADKNDVHVECQDDVLLIKGEKRDEREEKGEHRHFVERSFGSFSRTFRLPDDANGAKVKASFKDGVLTVAIPRSEKRKPKVVAIDS